MKRIITILALCAAVLVGLTACKNVKPNFQFQLELNGDVSSVSPAVAGDFNVNVSNVAPDVFNLAENAPLYDIESQNGLEANAWLSSYIEKNVLSYFSDAAVYDFYVKGYVKETNTGLVFSVDKRFTNKVL